jgi:Fe(3+) dicitrate transport protein
MNSLPIKIKQNLIALSLLLTIIPALAQQDTKEQASSVQLDSVTITGDAEDRSRASGSIHKIDEASLKQWHYSDVNRILEEVPGVYLRQEDGYGLRPNIGMRGSDANRSKKITLMEDGVLFAPAPYSAPAAYYFPMMARMQSVEVYKGLSSIKYGPNSVGGAINFVSRNIPVDYRKNGTSTVDLSAGSYGFGQLHGFYGNSYDNFGWLLEGVHMQSAGFKELDGGGNTGFDKNDLLLKFRFNNDPTAKTYHQLDIKLGYANETSHETYLGLSDDDFDANPYRRYVASKEDLMQWNHQQINVNYFFDPGGIYIINTVLYRRDFSRIWDKMNGFSGNAPLVSEILLNPNTPLHSVYYELLTGSANSTGPHENILVEAKDRDFISQGIQSQIDWELVIAGYKNSLNLGVRYHEDEVVRDHSIREFEIIAGDFYEITSIAPRDTVQNNAKARALSAFVFNEISLANLTISGGVRGELIRTNHHNKIDNKITSLENFVVLPGVGMNYKITDSLRVLAGVHKGFVSVTPGSDASVIPEKSINYEAGFRYAEPTLSSSVIGFFSDYRNLSGTCTFSLGCAAEDVDQSFNTGNVDIWGVESELRKTFAKVFNSSFNLPFTLVYTYTDSRFRNNFSSPRPDLVDVKVGDQLPNLPQHLLTTRMGLYNDNWQGALAFNYVPEMRTIAGIDKPSKKNRTDSQTVVDFSLNYFLSTKSTIYLTANNLFNNVAIVSRRPFGARPNKPRTFLIGLKLSI